MPLKIAHGVKLKNLPLEQKVALRLVWLYYQHKKTGQLRGLAKELGSTFMDVMKAVEFLAKEQVITFKPVTANEFEFEVEPENRKLLRIQANSYEKHLKARAARGRGPPKPYSPPPTHLTPITPEQRAPWMEKATVIATKLGVSKVAQKVANCLVRIGEAEVEGVLKSVLESQARVRAMPVVDPNYPSAVRMFFTMYTTRRNELLPPLQLVSIPPPNPAVKAILDAFKNVV